jgi:hypothetical protein
MPNLPKDVERYVKEHKEQGQPENIAWALAWSRYCKYKNPTSKHCQKEPSEYFKGRKAFEEEAVYLEAASKKEVIRGRLPPPNSPAAKEMALNPPSGGGVHHTRNKDVSRGRSRKEKHKGRSDLDRMASSPLSLRRDYGALNEEQWGDFIYDVNG